MSILCEWYLQIVYTNIPKRETNMGEDPIKLALKKQM